MEVDELMRAVIRSFKDADLRVELLPKEPKPQSPFRAVTTAVGDGQARPRCDSSAQAVSDQYTSVYRVNHCKVTPTSPPPMTTEFPPQRAELCYGRDNFEVGGLGSGAEAVPRKAECYRGGLSWTSRDAESPTPPAWSPLSEKYCTGDEGDDDVCGDEDRVPSGAESSIPPSSLDSNDKGNEVRAPLGAASSVPESASPDKEPMSSAVTDTFSSRPVRSTRGTVPGRFNDYDLSMLSTMADSSLDEPSTYKEAIQSSEKEEWLRAMQNAVHSPRMAHRTDAFASSLRKYPCHDCSAGAIETLFNCSLPITGRSPSRPYSSPPRRDHDPTTNHRKPRIYEQRNAFSTPESPTRDKSDEIFRKQIAKPEKMRNVPKETRGPRNNPKSISPYTRTHSPTACTDGTATSCEWYDTPFQLQGRSEGDNKPCKPMDMRSHPVNTPVQATATKISKEVETVPLPIPTRRTIATPLTPAPSFPEFFIQTHDLAEPAVTRSDETFIWSSTSVGTTISSVEIKRYNLAKVIVKKSKSLSDFRLKRDFKNEILDWLDDTNDPKIKEVQEMVLKNLNCRLKKTIVPETEKIKVRIGDCVKSRFRAKSSEPSKKIKKKKKAQHNVFKHVGLDEVNSVLTTDQSNFEDVIKEWLSNISIKKGDALRPVEKDQIFNTFVNRLKHLVVEQSKHFRELREEIMDILKEVPIEVNSRDRIQYLDILTDDLMYRLENISRDHSEIKTCKFDNPEKLNEYVPLSYFQVTEKETLDFELKVIVDVLKKRNMINPDLVKELMIALVDILKDSVCSNVRLEKVTTLLRNATKLPEDEVLQYAMKLTNHWIKTLNKKNTNRAKIHQFTVFMVQKLSENNIFKKSGTEMSQNSIGSVVDNIEVNGNQYKIQLGKQIRRWISDFAILKTHDKDFRQAAVLDLASDIVDRQKYLVFNKSRISDMDEVEHLKYQIYKWIKRLVGEENLEIAGHAAELMKMIRSISVPMLTKPQDQVFQSNRGVSSEDHAESGTFIMTNNNHVSRSKSNYLTCYHKEAHISPLFTDLTGHKVPANKLSSSRKQSKKGSETKSSHNKNIITVNWSGTRITKSGSSNPSASKKNNHSKASNSQNTVKNTTSSTKVDRDAKNDIHNNENQSGNANGVEHTNQDLGPSGLVTPMPTSGQKASSAAAKLMADWRPLPVFTPPPPGRPVLGQVHEEFHEYLENWAQQIPIPATSPDEVKVAETLRLGILKGIWKMITKIKTQPAVFQNKFYYEDVLGKEIDELMDCLPQSKELSEKRYMLKAQLLEKTTNVNELVKELETPDNYKEIITQDQMEKQSERIRKVVKLEGEHPIKMFEQMFIYCILDDFLSSINYENNDKVKDKAYKIKLLKNIQAYVDELKRTHGKEIEDLFSVVNESDIMRFLYNVPVPTDDTLKEDADEILLSLEIEQWMMNLPIVKNYDATEQRHRRRLRDALTKKLLEMEKSVHVANCCGETRVRQEISFFLGKVPLEEDQDLNINEMVDELTNRLQNREPSAKAKPVAIRNGQQNQQRTNGLSRLLHQSQLNNMTYPGASSLYSTTNNGALDEDEDAQYRAFFKTEPLSSTRIELQGDEWETKEGHDAQYRALFKDRPVSSSMIEPQAYGMDANAPVLPSFQQPYEQEPYFAYEPGQFQESARGGSFGYPLRGLLPHSHLKFQYPESPMHRHGQLPHRDYDNNGNLADLSLRDSQYQSIPGVDARHSIPPIMQPTSFAQPRVLDWEGQNEASGGFVSMIDHGPQSPVMNKSKQSFSNVHRQPHNLYQSRIHANEPLDAAPVGLLSSSQNRRTLIETHPPQAFIPDASQFSRGSLIQSRRNSVEIVPNIMQHESLEMSVHNGPQFSRAQWSNSRSHRDPDADMLQQDPGEEAGFVSMASHRSSGAAQAPPAPQETSARNQSLRQRINQSNRVTEHQPALTIERTPEHQPAPTIERAPEPLSADLDGIQQMISQRRNTISDDPQGIQQLINQSRNANIQASSHRAQDIQNRSLRNAPLRQSAPMTHEAVSSPASSQRIARGLSNIASTEISNQPAFFSTPNQRPNNNAPPNIRQRRQMEKERASVIRLFAENEDAEERCHCVERFRQWHSRGVSPDCSTCYECVQRGNPNYFYSYPYPLPYPYPYPPYVKPPYCRR